MEQEVYYDGYTLDGELTRLFKVWISIITSLCYSYIAGKLIPKGIYRLSVFLPIILLFIFLPLNLHSMHFCGITAFFITWLANFKLLLFAFDNGPLSDSSLSLPKFLAVACFPIKIQQKTEISRKPVWNYAIKGLMFASLIQIYDFSDQIHPKLLWIVYFFHIYFFLEVLLAMMAGMFRILLGFELEPPFNEPYLSTSLQDFWGRRWNIMVSRILRPTVYDRCLTTATRIWGRRRPAAAAALITTFLASGLMHELIFFYLRRSRPTGVTTWFFLFHGICVVVEVTVKRLVGDKVRVPSAVANVLTVGFAMMTGFWWFLPELFRCHAVERSFTEYRLLGEMTKDVMNKFEYFKDGLMYNLR